MKCIGDWTARGPVPISQTPWNGKRLPGVEGIELRD